MRNPIYSPRAAAIAALFAVCVAALFSTGCARVGALTEVNPDGSLTRTVTMRGAGAPEGGMKMGPGLTDLVDAPSGAGWKVAKATEENELVVTATRSVPAGAAPWSDVVIHADPVPDVPTAATAPGGAPGPAGPQQSKPKPGAKPAPQNKPAAKPKPAAPPAAAAEPSFAFTEPKTKPGPVIVTNEVSVRRVAPGRLEYREVFRWKGKRPEGGMGAPDPEMDEAFRKAVPPAVAADPALAKAIQTSIAREMLRSVFGPGEPIMPLLLFHTDYAEYRLRRNLTAAVRKAFREHAGEKMTEEQRATAEKQLVDALTRSITTKSKALSSPGGPQPPATESGEKKDDGGSPVALFIRVKMPGKVIETNGEYDEYTGEVVWPLYSAAAGFEDVVLTAICEVGK